MISLFLILLPLAGLLAALTAGSRVKVHVGIVNVTAILHCAGPGKFSFNLNSTSAESTAGAG